MSDPHLPTPWLRDAVANVAADGALVVYTPSMARILAAGGAADRGDFTIADLPLAGSEHERLMAGDVVPLSLGSERWHLRIVEHAGQRWLLGHDVADREALAVLTGATARARTLGAIAGDVCHDLNNLLAAALGLAGRLRDRVDNPEDRRLLDDLVVGTRATSRLLGALSRSLQRGPGDRVVVAAAELVADALAVVGKAAANRAIALAHEVEHAAPTVRTVRAQATQLLLDGLQALLAAAPHAIHLHAGRCERAFGAVVRPALRVRIVATGVAEAVAERLAAIVTGNGALVAALRTPAGDGLQLAVLMHRRLGGEVAATRDGERLAFDCYWPAASC